MTCPNLRRSLLVLTATTATVASGVLTGPALAS